jgi:hypothetical protein
MKIATSTAVAIACVLLAACGGDRLPRSSFAFTSCTGDCGITLSVSRGCVYQKTAIATMDLTGNPGQRELKWTLSESSPYTFSREKDYKGPIYVRGSSGNPATDPGNRFKNSRVSSSGKELTVTFDKQNTATSVPTEITYYLNLLEDGADRVKVWCEIDPWIVDK